eukprot:2737968-Amphidinium_carterae.1
MDLTVSTENHGGPVLNSRGEMIGMALRFNPATPQSSQAGMLIPSDALARSVHMIIEQGVCQRPSLGLFLACTDHNSHHLPQGAMVVE